VEHGRPSGIDNFVSVYGGMVLFNKNRSPPFKLIEDKKILNSFSDNFCICFVDSGIEKKTKVAVNQVLLKYNEYLNG
jgi:mevalonate kinase